VFNSLRSAAFKRTEITMTFTKLIAETVVVALILSVDAFAQGAKGNLKRLPETSLIQKFIDGEAVRAGLTAEISVRIVKDLDGDGIADLIFMYNLRERGTSLYSQHLVVFSGNGRQSNYVAERYKYETQTQIGTYGVRLFFDIAIKDGKILLTGQSWESGAMCCPDKDITAVFRLESEELVEIKK